MGNRTRLIETPEQLQEWIAGHLGRHRKVAAQECSCGWPGEFPIADTTWEAHESVMLLVDLGGVLPSNYAGESWQEAVDRLTSILDIFHENCKCEFEWPDK